MGPHVHSKLTYVGMYGCTRTVHELIILVYLKLHTTVSLKLLRALTWQMLCTYWPNEQVQCHVQCHDIVDDIIVHDIVQVSISFI